ncbi:MAG: hypothetical protein WKF73_06530 [Nocardioidaceae bacterium]
MTRTRRKCVTFSGEGGQQREVVGGRGLRHACQHDSDALFQFGDLGFVACDRHDLDFGQVADVGEVICSTYRSTAFVSVRTGFSQRTLPDVRALHRYSVRPSLICAAVNGVPHVPQRAGRTAADDCASCTAQTAQASG